MPCRATTAEPPRSQDIYSNDRNPQAVEKTNMENSDDLVSVYAAANLMTAHLVRNLLEAEGIAARVNEVTEYPAEFHVAPDVWVKQADLARAQAVLAEHDRQLRPPPAWPPTGFAPVAATRSPARSTSATSVTLCRAATNPAR